MKNCVVEKPYEFWNLRKLTGMKGFQGNNCFHVKH